MLSASQNKLDNLECIYPLQITNSESEVLVYILVGAKLGTVGQGKAF
jgi:hypothetical protein